LPEKDSSFEWPWMRRGLLRGPLIGLIKKSPYGLRKTLGVVIP
jgi:hypothetical protein